MPDQEVSPERDLALETLRASGSFAALAPAQLERVWQAGRIERGAPGHVFFRQGEEGDFAYLILSGAVEVEVETEAGRVTVARLGAGALVGEIGAFARTRRTATVIAGTEVAALRIEQATTRRLMEGSPDTAMAVIAELGARLQSLNGTLAILTQAARALAADEFEPDMMEILRRRADEFGHFADVFLEMASEIREKRLFAHEMATAAQIQQALLPSGIDAGDRAGAFEIAAAMTPARHVGGDFYDYFMVDPDTVGVAVGDVSGKGVPAAIFMSVSRTVLRTVARRDLAPGETLSEVNALLAEGNREAMFVTLAFGKLDLPSGVFTYAAGGHEEVLFVSPERGVETTAPTGPALGIFPKVGYGEIRRTLLPGETIVFATDGITEAFDASGAMFGWAGLEAALAANAGRSAGEMVANVSEALGRFVGRHPQSDDLTGLALRWLGPGAS